MATSQKSVSKKQVEAAAPRHTPGPWEAVCGRTMWTIRGPGFTGPAAGNTNYSRAAIPPEQREANARLIAAAPELLAACKLALTILDRTARQDVITGAEGNISATLRAAIAKAESR